jgi:hypothetical protein
VCPLTPLLLYLEDAPLGPGVAATGLSKAFNATLKGLVADTTRVCIVQTHQLVEPSLFLEEWRAQPAWAAPRFDWLLARLCARLPWMLASLAASLHGRWIAWRLRRAMPSLLPPRTRLLAPIGIDPLTLVRADSIARSLSADLEPYLVDDLQYHPANRRWKADLGNALSRMLQNAKRTYCITDGLGDLLHVRHAVRPRTLNLVAASPLAVVPHSQQVPEAAFAFFLGSINHLYAEGLNYLIEQVAELRQATGQALTIRISSSPAQVRAELGEVPSWVLVGSIADHTQLHMEMAAATFCYLPYSFTEEARSMVESSFPSKMIDYLAHANAILVLSPESAVPYRLMLDHDLPFTCASPSLIREQLVTLLNKRPILSSHYRCLLDELFSVRAMRLTLDLQDAAE